MKKSLLAFAALTALTGAASAQSSVTLFGVLDVNARSTHNGSAGTVKQVSSDGLTPSRLGFRGIEDIGDGLKAGFWLEAGLSADNGGLGGANGTTTTPTGVSKTFNRRSTVSLLSEQYGELRVGRDETPMKIIFNNYDPFQEVGLGEFVGNGAYGGTQTVSTLGRTVNTLTRADNLVSYILPSSALYGIVGQLTLAPGEAASGNRYSGGRLGYMNGPISAMAGYSTTQVDASSNDRFRQAVVGASYDFGVVKPMGQFLKGYTKVSTTGEAREQNVYLLGLTAPIGMGQVRFSYVHSNMYKGVTAGYRDSDDSRQLAVGYSYDLSKRTAVYATIAQIKNSGAARQIVASGGAAASMLGGQNSSGYDFGIRHSF